MFIVSFILWDSLHLSIYLSILLSAVCVFIYFSFLPLTPRYLFYTNSEGIVEKCRKNKRSKRILRSILKELIHWTLAWTHPGKKKMHDKYFGGIIGMIPFVDGKQAKDIINTLHNVRWAYWHREFWAETWRCWDTNQASFRCSWNPSSSTCSTVSQWLFVGCTVEQAEEEGSFSGSISILLLTSVFVPGINNSFPEMWIWKCSISIFVMTFFKKIFLGIAYSRKVVVAWSESFLFLWIMMKSEKVIFWWECGRLFSNPFWNCLEW